MDEVGSAICSVSASVISASYRSSNPDYCAHGRGHGVDRGPRQHGTRQSRDGDLLPVMAQHRLGGVRWYRSLEESAMQLKSLTAECAYLCGPPVASSMGKCVSGSCDYNQCTTDTDCSSATPVCSCQGQTFGWGHSSLGSVCIAGNCHTDADCGAGGWCSPTVDSGCGSFYGTTGYLPLPIIGPSA